MNASRVLTLCTVVFTTMLQRVVPQPFPPSAYLERIISNSLRGNGIENVLKTVMRENLDADGGISAQQIDIDYYNNSVEADPSCEARKIDESVTAAYVFYIHRRFHTDLLMRAKCPFFEKLLTSKEHLRAISENLIYSFSSGGYGDVTVEYNQLYHPEGSFNRNDEHAMRIEITHLKSIDKYYDPVKAGVATGMFQYIEPDDTMKQQWMNEQLKPLCLHRHLGGWFQFVGIMLITVPNQPKYRPRLYHENSAKFMTEAEAKYHILAHAIDRGANDVWRDYPAYLAQDIRYNLQVYIWEKTGVYYDEKDPPFVNATKIASAFREYTESHAAAQRNRGQYPSQGYASYRRSTIVTNDQWLNRIPASSPSLSVLPLVNTVAPSRSAGVGSSMESLDKNAEASGTTATSILPPDDPTVASTSGRSEGVVITTV